MIPLPRQQPPPPPPQCRVPVRCIKVPSCSSTRKRTTLIMLLPRRKKVHNHHNSLPTHKQPATTPEALEPKIEAILQEELVKTLREQGLTVEHYHEPDTAAVGAFRRGVSRC